MGNSESSFSESASSQPMLGTYTIPQRSPLVLSRKGSSFLEEPVITKFTEGGKDGAEHSLIKYACSEMQGWRSHMEDKHVLNPPLIHKGKRVLADHHLFAVFDGHGGGFASQFCGDNLARALMEQEEWDAYLKLLPSTSSCSNKNLRRNSAFGVKLLKSALNKTFLVLDARLKDAQCGRRFDQLGELQNILSIALGQNNRIHECFRQGTVDNHMINTFSKDPPPSLSGTNVQLERSGTTGVIVLITPDHIICANVGDSRAILARNGVALPLSFDHKPSNDVEVTRVDKSGGFVRNGRVDGDLAVSRALGDFSYKKNESFSSGEKHLRVSAVPDILVHTRDASKDQYIVLACDGIWDRLTNRDCAKLIRKLVQEEGETDIGLVCEEVIDTCLELDSRDNMTCCVVAFPGGMGVSEGGGGSIMKSRSKVGVMKRRNEREREWGPKSTPAKRAMERLEQRKLKMKLLMNSDQKLTKVRSSDGGSTLAKQ
jgi:serine/threonine protein phosphatase PrpC